MASDGSASAGPPEQPPGQTEDRAPARAWQIALYPLLMAYAALLLVASVPDNMRPGFLEETTPRARAFLASLKIRPGSFVFPAVAGEPKPDVFCLAVEGVREDGSVELLHSTYEGCKLPTIRVFENSFDIAVFRLSRWKGSRRLTTRRPEKREKKLDQFRRNKKAKRVSRYFCRSKQVSDEGFKHVVWTAYVRTQRLDSGRRDEFLGTIHTHDCERDRPRLRWKYEGTFREDYGPGIARDSGGK